MEVTTEADLWKIENGEDRFSVVLTWISKNNDSTTQGQKPKSTSRKKRDLYREEKYAAKKAAERQVVIPKSSEDVKAEFELSAKACSNGNKERTSEVRENDKSDSIAPPPIQETEYGINSCRQFDVPVDRQRVLVAVPPSAEEIEATGTRYSNRFTNDIHSADLPKVSMNNSTSVTLQERRSMRDPTQSPYNNVNENPSFTEDRPTCPHRSYTQSPESQLAVTHRESGYIDENNCRPLEHQIIPDTSLQYSETCIYTEPKEYTGSSNNPKYYKPVEKTRDIKPYLYKVENLCEGNIDTSDEPKRSHAKPPVPANAAVAAFTTHSDNGHTDTETDRIKHSTSRMESKHKSSRQEELKESAATVTPICQGNRESSLSILESPDVRHTNRHQSHSREQERSTRGVRQSSKDETNTGNTKRQRPSATGIDTVNIDTVSQILTEARRNTTIQHDQSQEHNMTPSSSLVLSTETKPASDDSYGCTATTTESKGHLTDRPLAQETTKTSYKIPKRRSHSRDHSSNEKTASKRDTVRPKPSQGINGKITKKQISTKAVDKSRDAQQYEKDHSKGQHSDKINQSTLKISALLSENPESVPVRRVHLHSLSTEFEFQMKKSLTPTTDDKIKNEDISSKHLLSTVPESLTADTSSNRQLSEDNPSKFPTRFTLDDLFQTNESNGDTKPWPTICHETENKSCIDSDVVCRQREKKSKKNKETTVPVLETPNPGSSRDILLTDYTAYICNTKRSEPFSRKRKHSTERPIPMTQDTKDLTSIQESHKPIFKIELPTPQPDYQPVNSRPSIEMAPTSYYDGGFSEFLKEYAEKTNTTIESSNAGFGYSPIKPRGKEISYSTDNKMETFDDNSWFQLAKVGHKKKKSSAKKRRDEIRGAKFQAKLKAAREAKKNGEHNNPNDESRETTYSVKEARENPDVSTGQPTKKARSDEKGQFFFYRDINESLGVD
ncbi:hypothetical protein SNE40_008661 [Patella caerulea]|uniref:Uncharacterized protein n=1 Tax=Patella caerulea TaxID=87958 RepID=A0AAN8JPL0_PATCE